MMPNRIPITTAKAVGEKHPDVEIVVLMVWDGKKQHVVTWGRSVEDCDLAAQAGNAVKRYLGWPEHLSDVEPNRVKKLRDEITRLRPQAANGGDDG